MSEQITPELVKSLIESNKQTNETVAELSKNVAELVQIEKVREERDKHQIEKNETYDKHIEKYTPVLIWAEDLKETIRKVKVPIIAALCIAVLALLGFNFGK